MKNFNLRYQNNHLSVKKIVLSDKTETKRVNPLNLATIAKRKSQETIVDRASLGSVTYNN